MDIHICPACGYPILTVGMCAACLPSSVLRQPIGSATAFDATAAMPAAMPLAPVADLGAKAG